MRSRRPSVFALGAALTTVLLFGACKTASRVNPFSQDRADRGEIEIRIINLNFSDATVWALIQDGRRRRLGIVSGKREETFVVPWTISETLRLEYDLLAGDRCFTERMLVDPGDMLELQIAATPSEADNCS